MYIYTYLYLIFSTKIYLFHGVPLPSLLLYIFAANNIGKGYGNNDMWSLETTYTIHSTVIHWLHVHKYQWRSIEQKWHVHITFSNIFDPKTLACNDQGLAVQYQFK